jgi:hypothetical protein
MKKATINAMSYISTVVLIMTILAWFVRGPLHDPLNSPGGGCVIAIIVVMIAIMYAPVFNTFKLIFSGFARVISKKIKGL